MNTIVHRAWMWLPPARDHLWSVGALLPTTTFIPPPGLSPPIAPRAAPWAVSHCHGQYTPNWNCPIDVTDLPSSKHPLQDRTRIWLPPGVLIHNTHIGVITLGLKNQDTSTQSPPPCYKQHLLRLTLPSHPSHSWEIHSLQRFKGK